MQANQFRVTTNWEGTRRIQHIGDAGRHTCTKVVAGLTKDDDHAASHIFAAVCSNALNDCERTTITYGKTLTGSTGSEEIATSCSIENGITDNRILLRSEMRVTWRVDDNLPTSHTLTNIIIGLTIENQAHTRYVECTEALTRRTLERTGDAHSWQTAITITTC